MRHHPWLFWCIYIEQYVASGLCVDDACVSAQVCICVCHMCVYVYMRVYVCVYCVIVSCSGYVYG